jgi:hypothetical protein
MLDYKTIDKTDWFIQQMKSGTFSSVPEHFAEDAGWNHRPILVG